MDGLLGIATVIISSHSRITCVASWIGCRM